MERVTRATAVGDADRRVMEFYEEKGILDPRFRTQNKDYLMSEWGTAMENDWGRRVEGGMVDARRDGIVPYRSTHST